MSNRSYSKLGLASTAAFDSMLRRFGVVTVMNVKVYDGLNRDSLKAKKVDEIITDLKAMTPLCELDTLKVANINVEGPSKTVTGGQYSNPLIKYGKTARLEMQDALGNIEALEAFGAGIIEHFVSTDASGTDGAKEHNGTEVAATNTHTYFGKADVFHVTSTFAGPKTLVGDTFFIDQVSGEQVPVKIIFYQFLPDSLFNLTQDAEGDATVFDLNGDLLMTDITIGDSQHDEATVGTFYSIFNGKEDEGIVPGGNK